MYPVENPILYQRTLANLTQAKLASLSGLTPLSILRHEQGLPSIPSGKIAAYFELDYIHFRSLYAAFQQYKRADSGRSIRDDFGGPISISAHPSVENGSFKFFRESILGYLSQASFCIDFCVHQSTLNSYERMLHRSMPVQLRTALDEAGILSLDSINQLEDIGRELYDARKQAAKAS